MKKVFVLGVDGAFPEYIFGDWLYDLPNLEKLIRRGGFAKLNSTIPPLSVTAWTSIMTGKPPADTGIFEYVYRKNFTYDDVHIVTSRNLKEKTFWEIASDYKKKSIICYPILSWPIKPFNGYIITGSLTPPGKETESVYPPEIKKEIEEHVGELPPPNFSEFTNKSQDLNFRIISKEQIIKGVYELTEKHFKVITHLINNKEWDLFFGLIGLSDRMNHAFWKFMDPEHRSYDPTSKFKNTLKEYYILLDRKIGELISILKEDTTVIILSDHGINRMHTRINLTDWLIKNNYMILKEELKGKREFNPNLVDWTKTRVFAIGAYECQIFINLKGREPVGIVEKEEYNTLLEELEEKLKDIPGDDGKKLRTEFFRKRDFFKGKLENEAPDMIVYFDGLEYGCNTTLVGNEGMYSLSTARGSDDAGHSKQGIFIMKNNKVKNKNYGEVEAIDIAPTILQELGIKIPNDIKGKIIK